VLALSRAVFWFDRTVIDGIIHLLARAGIISAKIADWTDRYVIDGFLNLLAAIVNLIGNFARRFQGGKVQYYLFSMLVIILALFILKIVF
jgi:NADH-quinone oxidoreductase subunit L